MKSNIKDLSTVLKKDQRIAEFTVYDTENPHPFTGAIDLIIQNVKNIQSKSARSPVEQDELLKKAIINYEKEQKGVDPLRKWNITVTNEGDAYQYQFCAPAPKFTMLVLRVNLKDGECSFEYTDPCINATPDLKKAQVHIGHPIGELKELPISMATAIKNFDDVNIQRIAFVGFARNQPYFDNPDEASRSLGQFRSAYASEAILSFLDKFQSLKAPFTTVNGGWSGHRKGYDLCEFPTSGKLEPHKFYAAIKSGNVHYSIYSGSGKADIKNTISLKALGLDPAKVTKVADLAPVFPKILAITEERGETFNNAKEMGITHLGHLLSTAQDYEHATSTPANFKVVLIASAEKVDETEISKICKASQKPVLIKEKDQFFLYAASRKEWKRHEMKATDVEKLFSQIKDSKPVELGYKDISFDLYQNIVGLHRPQKYLGSFFPPISVMPLKAKDAVSTAGSHLPLSGESESLVGRHQDAVGMYTQFVIPGAWGDDSPYLAAMSTAMVVLEPAGRWTQIEIFNALAQNLPVVVLASPENLPIKDVLWSETKTMEMSHPDLQNKKFIIWEVPFDGEQHREIRIYRNPVDAAEYIAWEYALTSLEKTISCFYNEKEMKDISPKIHELHSMLRDKDCQGYLRQIVEKGTLDIFKKEDSNPKFQKFVELLSILEITGKDKVLIERLKPLLYPSDDNYSDTAEFSPRYLTHPKSWNVDSHILSPGVKKPMPVQDFLVEDVKEMPVKEKEKEKESSVVATTTKTPKGHLSALLGNTSRLWSPLPRTDTTPTTTTATTTVTSTTTATTTLTFST